MKKNVFLFFTLLSMALFFCSIALFYPLGYHTNSFVFMATLLFWIFSPPTEFISDIKTVYKYIAGCLFLFFLSFTLTIGYILIPVFAYFDFEDECVFSNSNFRIVETEAIITSGGRAHCAVLKKVGICEYVVLRFQGYPRPGNLKIIETRERAMVVSESPNETIDISQFLE